MGIGSEDRGVAGLAARLIADALLHRPAPPKRTATFASLRHDAHLLPGTRARLDVLLEGFHRDTSATYDIQGFRDEGSDLLVRVVAGENNVEFVSLQVKSHVELLEPRLDSNLTLQWQRTVDRWNPIRYFILLFADLSSKSHQGAVRRVESAFAKKPGVSVVSPSHLATFWRLSPAVMEALVTSVVRGGDPLLEDSVASLMSFDTAVQAGLVLTLLAHQVEGEWIVPRHRLQMSDWFVRLTCSLRPVLDGYGPYPTEAQRKASLARARASVDTAEFGERLDELLEALDNDVEERDGGLVLTGQWHPLLALMHEASAKYELAGDDLIRYVTTLLFR